MWQYRGEFVAVGPDGAEHKVEHWADDDTGESRLQMLKDGTRVVRLGPGRYQSSHPSRGIVLTSDDPQAP